jgi:hypothetical protein
VHGSQEAVQACCQPLQESVDGIIQLAVMRQPDIPRRPSNRVRCCCAAALALAAIDRAPVAAAPQ